MSNCVIFGHAAASISLGGGVVRQQPRRARANSWLWEMDDEGDMDKLSAMEKSILKQSVTPTSVVCARGESEVVACRLADEAVLLQLASGTYYTLDEVGVALWEQLATPQKFSAIHRALLKLYDVDAQRLEADLLRLLNEMNAAQLITVETSAINA